MKYQLGMIIKTKKPHVCQNNEWEVIRLGADIKIRCLKCQREVMMAKYELDKRIIK
ncbi:MAG: DUF951 domain-containing protein [Acholeplasmatales bacterium]|jgi:hypothetical protein|nr:DUF951 domain-containing protein [Acholeplasmataceae bacterium]MCK9428127.1 DUF951 domain-containing protein [Acholeplasmataceae bacterium]MDD4090420.1 DUF951 domain-containing protein [Acholeplasmataceae bacterium]MDY0115557.1 DUF951 domain-containing protein [Acholeplasmatales bacterium]HHT39730.1 DUF951 domain-containing protein [Acholeplasmataceae bacterium]